MMDDEDPQHLAQNCRPPKKIVRRNRASSTYPNTEPGVGSPKVQNPFWEPSVLACSLQSASSPEVSADDLELRRTAEQLLIHALGAQRGGSTRVEYYLMVSFKCHYLSQVLCWSWKFLFESHSSLFDFVQRAILVRAD